MKKQAFNPYLPSYEYIPDGEPYVFGDRVYLFGSHDQFNGREFCPLDYVCWSAPVDDLSDWRKEGTTLTKDEAPDNFSGRYNLWAPDVCCGPDGRYYMYYFTSFNNKLWVASCDTPAGRYRLHDYVQYPDGTALGERKGDIFHAASPERHHQQPVLFGGGAAVLQHLPLQRLIYLLGDKTLNRL